MRLRTDWARQSELVADARDEQTFAPLGQLTTDCTAPAQAVEAAYAVALGPPARRPASPVNLFNRMPGQLRPFLKERFVLPGVFGKAADHGRSWVRSVGFNAGMGNVLWHRLSVEVQAEVDGLVSAGRNVQAIAVMRAGAGLPTPGLRECVDLVDQRFRVLRQGSASS